MYWKEYDESPDDFAWHQGSRFDARPLMILAPGTDELDEFCIRSLEECLESGDAPAEDEGVDVVGALVGVDRLQVHHVPVGIKDIW